MRQTNRGEANRDTDGYCLFYIKLLKTDMLQTYLIHSVALSRCNKNIKNVKCIYLIFSIVAKPLMVTATQWPPLLSKFI